MALPGCPGSMDKLQAVAPSLATLADNILVDIATRLDGHSLLSLLGSCHDLHDSQALNSCLLDAVLQQLSALDVSLQIILDALPEVEAFLQCAERLSRAIEALLHGPLHALREACHMQRLAFEQQGAEAKRSARAQLQQTCTALRDACAAGQPGQQPQPVGRERELGQLVVQARQRAVEALQLGTAREQPGHHVLQAGPLAQQVGQQAVLAVQQALQLVPEEQVGLRSVLAAALQAVQAMHQQAPWLAVQQAVHAADQAVQAMHQQAPWLTVQQAAMAQQAVQAGFTGQLTQGVLQAGFTGLVTQDVLQELIQAVQPMWPAVQNARQAVWQAVGALLNALEAEPVAAGAVAAEGAVAAGAAAAGAAAEGAGAAGAAAAVAAAEGAVAAGAAAAGPAAEEAVAAGAEEAGLAAEGAVAAGAAAAGPAAEGEVAAGAAAAGPAAEEAVAAGAAAAVPAAEGEVAAGAAAAGPAAEEAVAAGAEEAGLAAEGEVAAGAAAVVAQQAVEPVGQQALAAVGPGAVEVAQQAEGPAAVEVAQQAVEPVGQQALAAGLLALQVVTPGLEAVYEQLVQGVVRTQLHCQNQLVNASLEMAKCALLAGQPSVGCAGGWLHAVVRTKAWAMKIMARRIVRECVDMGDDSVQREGAEGVVGLQAALQEAKAVLQSLADE